MMVRVKWIRLWLLLITGVCALPQPPAVQKIWIALGDLTQAQTTHKKLKYVFTEAEVNEYLQHARVVNPRPGLDRMSVQFLPGNYVSTVTVIDFDLVEQARPGTVPVLLRPVLSGKREIRLDVRVNAANGLGTYSVEKAYFENVRIPAFAVEKMIQVVAARQREKFDLSKPLPLPFGVRSIVTGAHFMTMEN